MMGTGRKFQISEFGFIFTFNSFWGKMIQFKQYMFQVGWNLDHQPFFQNGLKNSHQLETIENSSKAAQLWLLSPINLSFSSRSLRLKRRQGKGKGWGCKFSIPKNESWLCWENGLWKRIQFWRDHRDFEHGTGWKVCLIDLMVMFKINSHHLK